MTLLPLETLAAFALTSLLIELTPGPNMAYLAVLAASNGHRAGIAATLGVAIGLALLGLAAALGLAALISSSQVVYQLLRWAGIAYMLWLAWETWRDGASPASAPAPAGAQDAAFFTRGLVSNLLNPKAALFYVAVLPAYIEISRPVLGQAVVLSLIYVMVATCVHLAIVMLAGLAGPLIARATGSRAVHAFFAVMLVAVAVWLALATARA